MFVEGKRCKIYCKQCNKMVMKLSVVLFVMNSIFCVAIITVVQVPLFGSNHFWKLEFRMQQNQGFWSWLTITVGISFFFKLSVKPDKVVPGSGIRFIIFEISGKPSFVLWRVTQFFYLLCSQFRQKASGWINKTLLVIKQQNCYPNSV
jgi:H+/Cl- antiporter ClcA